MSDLDSIVKELTAYALENGATGVKLIKPQDVVVAQWVRNKCQFGCRHYGKRFTCPPYAPTPAETAEILADYNTALLVEFANLTREKLKEPQWYNKIPKVLYEMERMAFLSGFQKAYCYKGGPCSLCAKCPAEELENPSIFHAKLCKQPKEARPAMEAAGIDVYTTVRRAGFELHVVRERSDVFKTFGLVLLE